MHKSILLKRKISIPLSDSAGRGGMHSTYSIVGTITRFTLLNHSGIRKLHFQPVQDLSCFEREYQIYILFDLFLLLTELIIIQYMTKIYTSRALKNLMHLFGTALTSLLYFSGYYLGDKNYIVSIALIMTYIVLGRLTSELAYRVDRRLLEEKVRGK